MSTTSVTPAAVELMHPIRGREGSHGWRGSCSPRPARGAFRPRSSGISRANSASEKCGVPRVTAASGAPSGTVESERAASLRSSALEAARRLAARGRRCAALEVRRFRGEADGVKQGDRAGRGRSGAERLQIVLVGLGRQADDRRNEAVRTAARRRGRPRRRPAPPPSRPERAFDLDERPGEPVLRSNAGRRPARGRSSRSRDR